MSNERMDEERKEQELKKRIKELSQLGHDEFIDKKIKLVNAIKELPLSELKIGDLPALLGILGLVDGITSPFHPSLEDYAQIELSLMNSHKKKIDQSE